jgi:hypothetical protein
VLPLEAREPCAFFLDLHILPLAGFDQREPWEGLAVATLISGEERDSGHEGMGANEEIGEDHLALTATLAIGRVGSGRKK